MNNTVAWNNIYDKTGFGNKYPSSYFVTLFHRRIKQLIIQGRTLEQIKVLDFGCSYGVNFLGKFHSTKSGTKTWD